MGGHFIENLDLISDLRIKGSLFSVFMERSFIPVGIHLINYTLFFFVDGFGDQLRTELCFLSVWIKTLHSACQLP